MAWARLSVRVGWCHICVSCESGFFCVDDRTTYLYIVLSR